MLLRAVDPEKLLQGLEAARRQGDAAAWLAEQAARDLAATRGDDPRLTAAAGHAAPLDLPRVEAVARQYAAVSLDGLERAIAATTAANPAGPDPGI